MNTKLSAPWYIYRSQVAALFDGDPAIEVGEVYQAEVGYAFDVRVTDERKYVALDRVLNRTRVFGNVALTINLIDAAGADCTDVELYGIIFDGNPIVKDIREVIDNAGVRHGYVRFWPEVVQFFADDLRDYDGNWTGLAQDIARDVFDGAAHVVNFCTASVRENRDAQDS